MEASGTYSAADSRQEMKECITHHLACDCREEFFKKLQWQAEQMKELVEALEFYAEPSHWHETKNDQGKIIPQFFVRPDCGEKIRKGGEGARQALKKYRGEHE